MHSGVFMIIPYGDKVPAIDPSVLIVPTATVIGDVRVGPDSSIWFQVVIRGDVNKITIGARTNIQDGTVIHVTNKTHSTTIGNDVTIGHNVTLHGCSVADRCLIGIGSIILDGAQIGQDCLIGAGSVIAPGTNIPAGSLVLGSPAKVKRDLTESEIAHLKQSAANYLEYRELYRGIS